MQTVASITDAMRKAAAEAGFELAGIAPVCDFEELQAFAPWIDAGHAGEMDYLTRRTDEGVFKRSSLQSAFPWARSAVVCAMNYNTCSPSAVPRSPKNSSPCPVSRPPSHTPPESRGQKSDKPEEGNGERGTVSQYAWSQRDYHDVVMAALRRVETRLRETAGGDIETRCYVDTGPLVERVVARYAGIGWIGKNTCIINQRIGSWLFLGVILTSLPVVADGAETARSLDSRRHRALAPHDNSTSDNRWYSSDTQRETGNGERETALLPDSPAPDRCGTCTRCLDACPTNAFIGPRQLDARRCISYLTIEKRGALPEELRAQMGLHVFGCDICQDVCPWNRRAPITTTPELQPRQNLVEPSLVWLATMTEEDFRQTFRGSPIKRAKRTGLRRNAVIAMGNSGERSFLPLLQELQDDADEIVAEHARWAIARLQSLGQEREKVCRSQRAVRL